MAKSPDILDHEAFQEHQIVELMAELQEIDARAKCDARFHELMD